MMRPGTRLLQVVCAALLLLWLCPSVVGQEKKFVLTGIHSQAIAFSNDGKWLAAAGEKPYPRKLEERLKMKVGTGGLVKVWESATGKQVFQYTNDDWTAECLAFSPTAPLLAAGFVEKWRQTVVVTDLNQPRIPAPVIIWNVTTGKEHRRLLHDGYLGIDCVAFSADGRTLATTSEKLLALWDIDSGKKQWETRDIHHQYCDDLRFSPNGQILACVTEKSFDLGGRPLPKKAAIELWDMQAKRRTGTLWVPNDPTTSPPVRVSFSSDGKFIAARCSGGEVRIFSVATGKLERTISANSGGVSGVAYSADGRWLFTCGFDLKEPSSIEGSWKVWDSETGKLVHVVKQSGIISLAVAPSGGKLATYAPEAETITLWSLPRSFGRKEP